MRIKFLKICLILIITMIVPTFMIRGVNVGAVNNNDTTYNSTYKTIEIKGKVEGANISNRIVTILLKHNNKIVNIGDTNIDINGNYNYKFRISEYKPDMVLSIKRGNGDITSTLTSAIVKTTELREVPYKIENQSNKTHIYADFSELLKYTSQFIPIILQCDENGELIRCTPYSSADLTDTYIFDKYIDTVAFKTKLLVWSSFDTMLPVGKMTDASNELQISFGSIADTQMNNGYIPLKGANNYSKYKNAVAELPSEFITINPAYPTIKREIYVSKTGNDANDGSINSPYLTLNKAIEKYKLLTLKEKNEWTAIYIREGRYDILTPLSLTGEVFGENGSAKLFIGAYNNEKVVLGNGKYVDGNIFKQVTNTNTDGATFGRINKNALGKIYYCDYSDLGITKLNGFSYGNAGAVPVLTFNGENQVLSRYPNSGENYISNVLQSGFDGNGNMTTNAEFIPDDKRPFNWEDTGTIGIKGQLSVTWFVNHMQASFDKVKQSITVPANQTVTKVDKTCWPISTNLKNHPEDKAHFFYYNVFEEIDMPGEWCGDDKNQRIYFYPPTQDILADDTIGITGECGDYKFKFNRVKDIVINGISFEFVEKGIEATECNNLLVQNCNFKNIQAMGVAFKFCKLSGVIYSDFRDCTRGISIVGEKSQVSNLVASRNFVQNCHFNGISANCIGIGETCGNIISHNLAENHMSSFTTIFGGSENVIEFNES
ncbi:MAG: hypothetical protein RSB38_08220, partial [Oscillospiraceae bacterium]